MAANQNAVICFFGDSNTYGFDPISGRYPQDIRWTDQVSRMAVKERYPWEFLQAGQNGREIPEDAWEISAVCRALNASDANALTVMLGSNDLLNMPVPDARKTGEKMKAFLLSVKNAASFAPSRILLVAPPAMKETREGGFQPTGEISRQSEYLPSVYRQAAAFCGVSFADASEWNISLAFDGVHFSPEGHRVFAWKMFEVLKKIL